MLSKTYVNEFSACEHNSMYLTLHDTLFNKLSHHYKSSLRQECFKTNIIYIRQLLLLQL